MPIRTILALLALISLAGMPLAVLMPILASDVLHGGPGTSACWRPPRAGALAGAVFLASRNSVLGLGRLMALMTA